MTEERWLTRMSTYVSETYKGPLKIEVIVVDEGVGSAEALRKLTPKLHSSRVKLPPLADSRAFAGRTWRAWRLWAAARRSQGEAQPLGALPRPRVLEPAASKAATFTAFDPSGTATLWSSRVT